jgi:hypothetical protein
MRRVISNPFFLCVVHSSCVSELVKPPENFTNFILMKHLFPDAGEIPNNAIDMLWGTFCFIIQFYIAALTLGTMLNYLVRTHICTFFF